MGKRGTATKGKRPTGRPSKFTPALGEEICERIGRGESLRKICKDPRVPAVETVISWAMGFVKDPLEAGFPRHYARAREIRSELYADECVDIADTESDVQRARVRIDTRKWVASKLLPKTYGDRLEVSLVKPEDLPKLTDEELAAIAAGNVPTG